MALGIYRKDSINMLTLVLLLSLLVSFLSIVMTVGNALNTTSLAKFWALIATASVFVSTFIFIVDAFNLMEVSEQQSEFGTEAIENEFDQGVPQDRSSQIQPIHNDFSNNDSTKNSADEINTQSKQDITDGNATDSRVARVMLLDLFAKRFSGALEGLDAEQKKWLMQNRQLFPVSSEENRRQINEMAEEIRGLDQVYKNIDLYKETIIKGTGVVLDMTVDETSGIREMQINLVGPDGGVYLLYYPDVVHLNTGDWVQFYGTPIVGKRLQSEFFGNVNSLLMYASYIGKSL